MKERKRADFNDPQVREAIRLVKGENRSDPFIAMRLVAALENDHITIPEILKLRGRVDV